MYSNYRLVSNLAFLHEAMVYKKQHSTEITWLYIQKDIFNYIDQHKVVFLELLDLSATFDSIDHELLINRLSSRLGLFGCVLDWFRSYLKNRSQRVKLDNVLSDRTLLGYGVHQGSVLEPILFSIYVFPLYYIIKNMWLPNTLMLTTLSCINLSIIILLSQKYITQDASRHVSRK